VLFKSPGWPVWPREASVVAATLRCEATGAVRLLVRSVELPNLDAPEGYIRAQVSCCGFELRHAATAATAAAAANGSGSNGSSSSHNNGIGSGGGGEASGSTQVRCLNIIEPNAGARVSTMGLGASSLTEPDRVLAVARLRVLAAPLQRPGGVK